MVIKKHSAQRDCNFFVFLYVYVLAHEIWMSHQPKLVEQVPVTLRINIIFENDDDANFLSKL
jgi:hypothetical protein